MQSNIWPNFFIAGTMKAGTTSLNNYLSEVNGVYMSPIKEPNYFASKDIELNGFRDAIRDENAYLSLFMDADKNFAIGEASTDYFYAPHAPELIHSKIPEAKIIMLLRDPIDRAFSHYLSNVRYRQFGVQNLTFYEALKRDYSRRNKRIGASLLYVEFGLYFDRVNTYLNLFGQNNVRILFFEEFTTNTELQMKGILKFLNVKSQLPDNLSRNYNKYIEPSNRLSKYILGNDKFYRIARLLPESRFKDSLRNSIVKKTPVKPAVSSEAKDFLYKIFADDVENLSKLLKRSVPWKNFT